MKKIVLLAVILRILVASFYFHPDIKTYYFQTSFLKSGVLNIYKYLIDNKENLTHKEEFVYYPLTYLTLGLYQAIISPFVGNNFDFWLNDASYTGVTRNQNVFLYLLIMKVPYVFFDLLIAGLLLKVSKKAFIFWLFNPFTIIIFYVFSNIDIMPIFFTLLSYLFAKSKKYTLASLMLGFGAAFKIYPFLLLPFLVIKGRNLRERIVILVLPIITFGSIVLPFWSREFIYSALVSGLTTRIVNFGFIIFYTLLFYYVLFSRKGLSLLSSWIIVFLIIFTFANYHIQWLAWISPFLVILLSEVSRYKKIIFFLVAVSFLIPLLYNDRSMSWGLLRLYSSYYDLLPIPFVVLSKFIDPFAAQKILHIALAVGGTSLTLNLLKRKDYE